jgi:hypothetical protein
MVSQMWERDTLFLLFEQDFRFTPNDIEPQVSYKPQGLVELVGDPTTFLESAGAEIHGEQHARPGVPGQGRWYEIPTKEKRAAFSSVSSRLMDIVDYATLAHRASCGDLIWMCWQPGQAGSNPKRKGSPASGGMFIMLTVPGAVVLNSAMESKLLPMGHFDCQLLSWMRDLPLTSLRACYILPPVGNYAAHQSGCEKVFAGEASVRPSCWEEKWCCPGTRMSEDPDNRKKWLCAFTSKGPPGWLCELPNLDNVTDVDLHWLTYWAVPGRPRPVPMEYMEAYLEQRGPPATAGTRGHPPLPVLDANHPKRQKRKERLQLFCHGLRFYTNDRAQA